MYLSFTLSIFLSFSLAATVPSPSPVPSIHPAPKSRFYLSNLTSAYYTSLKPVPSSLFGPLAVTEATESELSPYSHPRIVVGPKEWETILQKHVINFNRPNSWSKSLLRLTKGPGPDNPFLKRLADLEESGFTSLFVSKPRHHMTKTEISAMKPLADELLKMNEYSSHALFLCSFWASVSERQHGEGFLGENPSKQCIDAAVAWAKVLMAHRAYHCHPVCRQMELDPAKTYLWNTDRNWEVSQDWFTSGLGLALNYDTLYHKMNEEQRRVIRSALALLVMKRWTWGTAENTNRSFPNAETDPHRIYGNWAMYHSNLYLTNLAIEGESGFVPYAEHMLKENLSTGFNKRLNEKFNSMIDSFVTHTINPDGSTFEDGYTYHIALREGSLALIASHRRGSNLLASDRFKNTIHNAAQMVEPWQCGDLIGHSSGGGLSYPAFFGLFRYAYPEGPLPRMLWGQRFGKNFTDSEECRIYWTQSMTQVTLLGDEHIGFSQSFADSPETLEQTVKENFPLAYVSARRGLVITRASYSQRSSYMHFDARPDSFFLGHDNADRGVITFSALKRRWLDDLAWVSNEGSRRHTLMHIDGVAQAMKAPSVTIMKSIDSKQHCITSADLSYAYNVQWAKAWQGSSYGTTAVKEYNEDGSSHVEVYKFSEPENHSPWDLGWPMEDDASEIGFNRSMTLNGYPNLAFAGMYQWKRNLRKTALTHMVRSTVMVRSPQNEVGFGVLVDVVGTQSGSHSFESYLILKDDVRIHEELSNCRMNECKITLKSTGEERVDLHVRTIGTDLSYRVEEFDNHKRLIVKSAYQVKEEFWIALHPYEGEPGPFKMTRFANKSIAFDYHGEKFFFSIDGNDHSVVASDSPSRDNSVG